MDTTARQIGRQNGPQDDARHGSRVNVGALERVVSVLGGSALVVYGLRRGAWSGSALAATGGVLLYRGLTGHCPAYGALGISTAPAEEQEEPNTVSVACAMTIERAPEEVYAFWRDLKNLPRFMSHLKSVVEGQAGRSHWVARMLNGPLIEWNAEIIEQRPGKRIAWRSLPGSQVQTEGSVNFVEAGDHGTEVHVRIEYRPPAGAIGRGIAELLNPITAQQVKEDVRRFKAIMEAGEVPTVEGQPSGRGR